VARCSPGVLTPAQGISRVTGRVGGGLVSGGHLTPCSCKKQTNYTTTHPVS